tara:strand:+ start:114 stop:245 length:132 start_codon:yes stop_codon:yes gene_type:complete
MNDPKFVKTELKVTASEELEEELEEKSIASIIQKEQEEDNNET